MRLISTPDEAKSRLSNFKDKNWRAHQEEAIDFITKSDKKFKIIKARTGFGKSLVAMVSGAMTGDLNYLVQSKFLQTQLVHDFPEMASIWGRNNYTCAKDHSRTCDECMATESNPCNSPCEYKQAKAIALSSSYRCMNFSYFLAEIQYAGRFSGRPFTIVDEADSLENTLLNNVTLEFTEKALYRLGIENGPKMKTATSKDGLSSWSDFGRVAYDRAMSLHKDIVKEVENMDKRDEEAVLSKLRDAKFFIHIAERCKIFLNNMDRGWLYEEVERYGSRQGKTIFRPTWLSPELSNEFLFKHSQEWLLISATFLPMVVLCKQLGLDIDEIDYKELPSTFPPEQSPVMVWPVANVVTKELKKEVPKLIEGIKKILDRHKGQRGLLHTVSYKLCKEIMDGVDSPRLITHTPQNRQDIIDAFVSDDKNLPKDAVLVSPSSERGLDLRDHLCDFVIVAKCPYLSIMDKVTSARLFGSGDIGKLYYRAAAMVEIEQMCGRGMRSKSDSCASYLIDYQIEKVYNQNPSLWSEAFKECVVWGDNELVEES